MAQKLSKEARLMFGEIGPTGGGFFQMTQNDYDLFRVKYGWDEEQVNEIFSELIAKGYAEQLAHYYLFEPAEGGYGE